MTEAVKLMASVSGRTVVNIFDSHPLFLKNSPIQLLEYMQKCSNFPGDEFHDDVRIPEGSTKILRRPPDYTFKNSVTRAHRTDDPVAIQKSRAEQLHHVEACIRGSLESKYVNYDY
jgi:hypothetical protein